MNLEEFTSRIDGSRRTPTGNGNYLVSCPCLDHGKGRGDLHPSLSVSAGATGGVVLFCHAGCTSEDVVTAFGLRMTDLMGGCDQPRMQTATQRARGPEANYPYQDENGVLLFEVLRYAQKKFVTRRPDGCGDWIWNLDSTRRVLYRLPDLMAGVAAGEPVFVCEGEKDVDALRAAGAVATCNPHGAGKWKPEYGQSLRGAHVTVVRDKDEAGRKHAFAVTAALSPLCTSLRIVEAAEGKDAADHLAAGYGLDDFVTASDSEMGDVGQVQMACDPNPEVPLDGGPLVLEAAHAEVLAAQWLNRYRWASHERTWRQWTGRVWKRADESVVINAAQKVLRKHYGRLLAKQQTAAEDKRLHELHLSTCRYRSVQLALAFLKGEPGFHTEFEAWDADPYTLNCADGLLDMRTQTLRPHDPGALCTKITRWSFAGQESTGSWECHLHRCLPDEDVRRQVQRDLGRALVGAALEESLPIWHGTGANGKTTTARTILMGVDAYGRQAVKDLLVASKFERHSTELADLAGSRIVIAEEIQDGKHLDEATVKMLTGGNRQKARFMRGDNFEFDQTFSISLLVNHRPVITGTDKGIWRRLRLVPWTVSIPLAEQRPQEEMVAELMADGSWMLRWMVQGFADWQADHHWIAEPVRVATAAYEAEQDVLAGFLNRRCVLHPQAIVAVDALYAEYVNDSEEDGEEGVGPLSKIAFGKRLKSRNIAQERANGSRMWRGIGVVTTSDRNSG